MSEQRRPAGFLRDAILRLLRENESPVTGLSLAEAIHAQGHEVAPSLVFRELRKLTERSVIRKLISARGYIPSDNPDGAALICAECGRATEIPADGAPSKIAEVAAATGFTVSRLIIEVPGRCAACRPPGSPRG